MFHKLKDYDLHMREGAATVREDSLQGICELVIPLPDGDYPRSANKVQVNLELCSFLRNKQYAKSEQSIFQVLAWKAS